MSADVLHEMGPVIIAVTALFTLFGGGLWRVWSVLKELRDDIDRCKARDAEKDRQLHTMGLCLRLLIPEIGRLDPTNHTLDQVRSLLDQSFPVDLDTPPDMLTMIDRIEKKRKRSR
jgi:hypothetical protein